MCIRDRPTVVEVGDTVEVIIKAADQTLVASAEAFFSSVVSDSVKSTFGIYCEPPVGAKFLSDVGGTVICSGSQEIGAEHFSGIYEVSSVYLSGGLGVGGLNEFSDNEYFGPGDRSSGVVAGDGRGGEYRKYGECLHDIEMPTFTVIGNDPPIDLVGEGNDRSVGVFTSDLVHCEVEELPMVPPSEQLNTDVTLTSSVTQSTGSSALILTEPTIKATPGTLVPNVNVILVGSGFKPSSRITGSLGSTIDIAGISLMSPDVEYPIQVANNGFFVATIRVPVSYTHLTLPTSDLV